MANDQTALELIERAAEEGWTELDLSEKLLTSLPPKIAELTKLTTLNLSYNLLTSLPAGILRLTNLTSLYLGSNQLKRMPSDIEELTNLTSLDLNNNQLTSLPQEITTLTNLISLDLTNNQLTALPPEIINLTNLASLDLSNNELTSVPPEVINLTGLTSLAISNNLLDTHPGFHPEGPQGLIDPILKITDCDLLIGIFWKRFGTPTADGKTGTEHEFSLAYEAWQEKHSPQIFVYFNQKAYTPKSKAETEQWGQVLGFKEKFPKEGLWWPYKGKPQFERLVRNHLTNYIRTLSNSHVG